MSDVNKVLYNIDQREQTSEDEKKTARDNIGAQGALTAGQCVRIVNDTISAAGVVYIGVDTSSMSPQDAVWSAVNDALDNNRLPVLVSGQMNATLFWAFSANHSSGVDFSRAVGGKIHTLTINRTDHKVSVTTHNAVYSAGDGIYILNNVVSFDQKLLDSLKMWDYSTSVYNGSPTTTGDDWRHLTNESMFVPRNINQSMYSGRYWLFPKISWAQSIYPTGGTIELALQIIPSTGLTVSYAGGGAESTTTIDGHLAIRWANIDASKKIMLTPAIRLDVVNNNDNGDGGINFYWWFKINGTLDHALDQNRGQWSGYSSLCVPWLAISDTGTSNYQSVWIERM